jgi:uncharacterized protein (TIGR03435 family)
MKSRGARRFLVGVFCAVPVAAILWTGTGLGADAQTAQKELSFEVATVKPIPNDKAHSFDPYHFGAHVTPAGASYWHMSVLYLVAYAYNVDFLLIQGPDWIKRDNFDIEARFADGANQKDDRQMLQSLLKDRFQLKLHIRKEEIESDVLLVGRHGEKLKSSLPDPAIPESGGANEPEKDAAAGGSARPRATINSDGASTLDMGKRGTQALKIDPETGTMHWERSRMTMDELAKMLRLCTDGHAVVNETGLKGNYQVVYDCPPAGFRVRGMSGDVGAPPPDPGGSSLERSLAAMGLKLEKRKVLEDVYVIDHVEQPSAN